MHASNEKTKMGSDTIITFPRSAHPFGCGTALAQRLDLLPEPLPTQRPALVRACADCRQYSLLEMTDWNDCR